MSKELSTSSRFRIISELMRKYRIPEFNIPFLNRESELKRILDFIFESEVSWNRVIYGPWGCGKTELGRFLASALSLFKDVFVLYVDLSRYEIHKAFITVPKAKEFLIQIVKEVLRDFLKVPLSLYELFTELKKRITLKDKYIVVIIDEITKSVEKYGISIRDYVSAIDRLIHELREDLKSKPITTLMLTSDQTATFIFRREVGKSLSVYMMWHLDEDTVSDFAKIIDSPLNPNMLWKLTGGCPRDILELKMVYKWNVNEWISRKESMLYDIYEYAKRRGIIEYLREIVDDVDRVVLPLLEPSEPEDILTKMLLENNIIIRLESKYNTISRLPHENWIGKRWAWQQPIYKIIFEKLLRENSLNISS